MKTLAVFILSGFLLISAGVAARAEDCGFPPALQIVYAGRVDAAIVKALEDGQNCLNAKLQDNDYLKIEMYDLQDKLKQTELDLHTAETKIETLEQRLKLAEDAIQDLRFDSPIPPHPASKKSAANKSSSFIPDTPDSTAHPASKKSAANKPKAPVNKPTPQ